jgi:hypothetical protein
MQLPESHLCSANWRRERYSLVQEVHGKTAFGHFFVKLAQNKVSSRVSKCQLSIYSFLQEKAIKSRINSRNQLNDQKYADFLFGCNVSLSKDLKLLRF